MTPGTQAYVYAISFVCAVNEPQGQRGIKNIKYVGFESLTEVAMKSSFLFDIALFITVRDNGRFGGNTTSIFRVEKPSRNQHVTGKNQRSASCLLLLGLLFDRED
jgi:hypothetical protein